MDIIKRLAVATVAGFAVYTGLLHDAAMSGVFSGLFVYSALLYIAEVIEGNQ
jgi:hypothetical protein